MGKEKKSKSSSAKASKKDRSNKVEKHKSKSASRVAAAAVPPPVQTGVHNFESAAFLMPGFCGICSGMLWGFWNSGYQCSKCQFCAHYECVPKVPLTCGMVDGATAAKDGVFIDNMLEFPRSPATVELSSSSSSSSSSSEQSSAEPVKHSKKAPSKAEQKATAKNAAKKEKEKEKDSAAAAAALATKRTEAAKKKKKQEAIVVEESESSEFPSSSSESSSQEAQPLCDYCRIEPRHTVIKTKSGKVFGEACSNCVKRIKKKEICKEPPEHDKQPPEPRDRLLNNKANAAFAEDRIEDAIELYTQAMAVNPEEAVYYSNRSVCLFRVDRFEESLADADKCIQLCVARGVGDKWDKPYYRKAKALMALNRLEEASDMLADTVKMFPQSQAISQLYGECQDALAEEESSSFLSSDDEEGGEKDESSAVVSSSSEEDSSLSSELEL